MKLNLRLSAEFNFGISFKVRSILSMEQGVTLVGQDSSSHDTKILSALAVAKLQFLVPARQDQGS